MREDQKDSANTLQNIDVLFTINSVGGHASFLLNSLEFGNAQRELFLCTHVFIMS